MSPNPGVTSPLQLWSARLIDETSSAFYPHFGFGIFNQRIQVFLDLRHAQDLFDGGQTGSDLVPTVGAQGAHAKVDGFLSDSGSRSTVKNQGAKSFIEDQE